MPSFKVERSGKVVRRWRWTAYSTDTETGSTDNGSTGSGFTDTGGVHTGPTDTDVPGSGDPGIGGAGIGGAGIGGAGIGGAGEGSARTGDRETGLALSRRSARRAAKGYPPRPIFTSALLIVLGALMIYIAHQAQASPWMYVFAVGYIAVGLLLALKPGRPRRAGRA